MIALKFMPLAVSLTEATRIHDRLPRGLRECLITLSGDRGTEHAKCGLDIIGCDLALISFGRNAGTPKREERIDERSFKEALFVIVDDNELREVDTL
jgi:hypothetical protein